MPTFRTAPSSSLTTSIRNMIASGGNKLGPVQEMAVDEHAARTAHNLGLAEKARAEVEAMQAAQAQRADPALRTEYAAHAAGIDLPAATRLSGAIRGQMEQPGPSDIDDAAAVGAEAQPYPMARPNLQPGQERVFRSALASTIGNLIATGKTNAEQLAHASDRTNETALTARAAEEPDVPTANRIVAAVAGKVREPYQVGPQGQVLNQETGGVKEDTALAGAVRKLRDAQASAATASAAEHRAKAGTPANGEAPSESVPGGTGTKLMQEGETGTKYAVNEKTGRAWKATEKGWEPVLVTNLPKNLAKFGASATQGNREAVFTQRVIQSGNQAAHDLHNVVQLPLTASTGVFGGRKQGPSLFDATKEVMANKMTGQEVQSYNVMSTGFQRALANIETQGLAPAGSLTHQMDAVLFKEGDTNLTKLHKLAQIRQIVTSGMEVMLDNPRVSEMEKGRIRTVLDRVNKAVPFTHEDLIKLDKAQELDPSVTLASIVKKLPTDKPAKAAPAAVNDKGWKLMRDANGNQAYVGPNNEIEEVK